MNLTVHERVREWIRSAISAGELQPGSRLVQSEIAQRLRVSVTPVREAMRDLAAEGVIRFDARRGATVNQIEVADIEEALLLHEALEPVWARLVVARLEERDLVAARALQAQMEAAADISTYRRLNREFHTHLYSLSGAPRLTATLTTLRDSVDVVMSMTFSIGSPRYEEGLCEHRDLLDALAELDAERAARISVDHVGITLRNARAMVAEGTGEM